MKELTKKLSMGIPLLFAMIMLFGTNLFGQRFEFLDNTDFVQNPVTKGTADVKTMVADKNGNVYVGGGFNVNIFDKTTAIYLAVWNENKKTWSKLDKRPGGPIRKLVLDETNNKLYASYQKEVRGKSVAQLWQFDLTSKDTTNLTPNNKDLGLNFNLVVVTLAFNSNDNTLYCYAVNSKTPKDPVARVMKLDLKQNPPKWSKLADNLINTTKSPIIRSIAFDDSSDLFVAGAFSESVATKGLNHIAKWDDLNNKWENPISTGYTLTAADQVMSIVFDGTGDLYAGSGYKDKYKKTHGTVLKISNKDASDIGGFDDIVETLVFYENNLYAGGDFLNSTLPSVEQPMKRVAKYESSGWSQVGWGYGPEDVTVLEVSSGGNLYAAGYLFQEGGIGVSRPIARFVDEKEIFDLTSNEDQLVWVARSNRIEKYQAAGDKDKNDGKLLGTYPIVAKRIDSGSDDSVPWIIDDNDRVKYLNGNNWVKPSGINQEATDIGAQSIGSVWIISKDAVTNSGRMTGLGTNDRSIKWYGKNANKWHDIPGGGIAIDVHKSSPGTEAMPMVLTSKGKIYCYHGNVWTEIDNISLSNIVDISGSYLRQLTLLSGDGHTQNIVFTDSSTPGVPNWKVSDKYTIQPMTVAGIVKNIAFGERGTHGAVYVSLTDHSIVKHKGFGGVNYTYFP